MELNGKPSVGIKSVKEIRDIYEKKLIEKLKTQGILLLPKEHIIIDEESPEFKRFVKD